MNTTGFSRKSRLLDQASYNQVFKHPDVRITSTHLLLLAKKNNLTYPRLGLAISKKRAPLAISRNAIKRQAREVFRIQQHELPCYDMVFLLRKNISKTNSKKIRSEYLSIFEQLLANHH